MLHHHEEHFYPMLHEDDQVWNLSTQLHRVQEINNNNMAVHTSNESKLVSPDNQIHQVRPQAHKWIVK